MNPSKSRTPTRPAPGQPDLLQAGAGWSSPHSPRSFPLPPRGRTPSSGVPHVTVAAKDSPQRNGRAGWCSSRFPSSGNPWLSSLQNEKPPVLPENLIRGGWEAGWSAGRITRPGFPRPPNRWLRAGRHVRTRDSQGWRKALGHQLAVFRRAARVWPVMKAGDLRNSDHVPEMGRLDLARERRVAARRKVRGRPVSYWRSTRSSAAIAARGSGTARRRKTTTVTTLIPSPQFGFCQRSSQAAKSKRATRVSPCAATSTEFSRGTGGQA